MIPKKIHYIWLGNNPIPEKHLKYMESWKKYCPDYEIIRHDETNLNIDINMYCRQAYDSQKWAFASDVLRYLVLFEEGGIYLDTDVELIKPLDDFLQEKLFFGFETKECVAPGLILGAEKGNKYIGDLLKEYSNRNFINQDNSYNLKTICDYCSEYLYAKGLIPNGQTQHYAEFSAYAIEVFNPANYSGRIVRKTKKTYSIHHYASSWKPKKTFFQKVINKIKKMFKKTKK